MSSSSFGGPRVAVSVAEPSTVTGGSLDATVVVSGEMDEKVRGLRVELLYVNEYRYERRETDHHSGSSSGSSTTRTIVETTTEDVVVQTINYPLDTTPSIVGERAVQLWVPADAPPTAGPLVRWKVRAVIDRKLGGDVTAEARVVVASTRESGAARAAAAPEVDEQLEITLSDRHVRPGDTVSGVLVVKPGKTVKFTDVRVEIQSHRRDQDGLHDDETIAGLAVSGKTEVEGGSRREFPFELQVPLDAMPSFTASRNEVHYDFVASGARRLRTDYNATAPLHVFGGDA